LWSDLAYEKEDDDEDDNDDDNDEDDEIENYGPTINSSDQNE